MVEVDGEIHDEREGHDAERDRIMMKYGFYVLRFTNDAVLEALDTVLAKIEESIQSIEGLS